MTYFLINAVLAIRQSNSRITLLIIIIIIIVLYITLVAQVRDSNSLLSALCLRGLIFYTLSTGTRTNYRNMYVIVRDSTRYYGNSLSVCNMLISIFMTVYLVLKGISEYIFFLQVVYNLLCISL